MTQAIVNLALPVISNKVEGALQNLALSSHHYLYALPAFREQLITYVLKRMPTMYAATPEVETCSLDVPINCFSREQQRHMDILIHEGIQHLTEHFREHGWVAPESSYSNEMAPSSWFG